MKTWLRFSIGSDCDTAVVVAFLSRTCAQSKHACPCRDCFMLLLQGKTSAPSTWWFAAVGQQGSRECLQSQQVAP